MTGVYKNKDTFIASFTFKNKHISLGTYKTEKEAHIAYLEAQKIIKTTLDFYTEESPLPFEKWVSILNFRENKIYIRTPIYLRKSYFEYYLSPKTVMKFDVDDLFYYSGRKIQKRGGHLFVSDFGMQVNILSRYGIRNFARKGRDYIFLNGDDLDFRYSNIRIINRYKGVKAENDRFVTRILINGYVIVGKYKTETEAAVAYNKAADCLEKKYSIKKEKNFIENLTSSKYKQIYQKISINKSKLFIRNE